MIPVSGPVAVRPRPHPPFGHPLPWERAGFWLVLLALFITACPDDKPKLDDPLIKKLQAEQERIAKSGKPAPTAPVTPPENPLLERVQKIEAPRDLPIAGQVSVTAGKSGANVTLLGLSRSTSLQGAKMALTSDAVFLAVKLSLMAGATPTTLELPAATLMPEQGEELPVARDAQAVMGQRLTTIKLQADATSQLVLYFDVPEGALKPGLKLKIPAGQEPVMMTLLP